MANNIAVKITADVADLTAKRAIMSAELKLATKDLNDFARTAASGGVTAELRAGMLKAAEATAKARAEIRGLDTELKQLAVESAEAARSPVTRLGANFTEARGAVAEFGEAVVAAFAVEQVAEFAKQMGEAAEKTVHMAMAFGLTGEEAQRFNAELIGLGIAPEAGERAFVRLDGALTRARSGMKAQSAAFKEIGVDISKPIGQLALFNETISGLSKVQDVPTRIGLAMQLMGRGIQDIAPLLGVTKERFEEVNKVIDESGAVDREALQQGLALAEAQNTQKVAAQGLGNVLTSSLAPAFTALTQGVAELTEGFVRSYHEGGAAKDVMTVLGFVLKALISIVEGLVVGVVMVVSAFNGLLDAGATVAVVIQDTLGGAIRTVIGLTVGLGKVLFDVFSGDLRKAISDATETMHEFGRNVGLTMDNIAKDAKEGGRRTAQNFLDGLRSFAAGGENLRVLWGVDKDAPLPQLPKGGGGGTDMQGALSGGKGKRGPSVVSEWTEQLHAQEIASGEFFKDQTANELAFWQSKLALTKQGSKDWLDVQSKIYEAQKKLAHDTYDDHIATLNDQLEADRNNWVKEQADWNAKLAFIKDHYGEESKQYKEAHKAFEVAERQHQQTMAEIDREGAQEALRELKANLDAQATLREQNARTAETLITTKASNSGDPRAEAQAAQQILALHQQLNQQKLADDEVYYKTADDFLQSGIQRAQQVYGTESTQYTAALDAKHLADVQYANQRKVLENQTANQAIQDQLRVEQAWRGAIDPMVKATGSAMVGLINGTETWGQALVQIGSAIEDVIVTAIEKMVENWIISAITGQAATATTATAQVLSNAAVAGSAAFASTAMIPIIGPELAPAAAAAAYAGAASFAALASLDVGTNYVPDDMIAQIHAGERIIPAADNSALMSAVANNNRPSGSRGDVHLHYAPSVHERERIGLSQLLREGGGDMLAFLRTAHRDGKLKFVTAA